MKRKRRGSPTTEDDAGNGNHQSSSHSKKNQKGKATGTHIEAAQDDSPLRVTTTAEEEEDTAVRALLTEKGFDPNDLKKRHAYGWTPLTYFSYKGNIAMIRYLTARGADCRKTDMFERFPLYVAAMEGHVEIVQFLSNECGAHEDIRTQTKHGDSPLHVAFYCGHLNIVYWFTRNGALSSPRTAVDGGGIDDRVMRRDLSWNWDEDKRLPILAWAQETVTTHANFQLLLTGTIVSASSVRRHPKNRYRTRSKRTKVSHSPLEQLNGKSGVLKVVAEYAGYPTPQELRTLRQLIRLLTAFIKEVPFVPKNS